MSQFEQKYYKHYHVKSPKKIDLPSEEYTWDFWSWSKRYRLFEILVVLLLLLILLCLCFRCSGNVGVGSSVAMPSLSVPVVGVGGVGGMALAGTTGGVIGDEVISPAGGSSGTQGKLKHSEKQEKLGMKYSTRVVPEARQLAPSGNSNVTIEEYMYYAHETGEGYPNFIDATTSRAITSKQPECYTLSCPVIGITQSDKENYVTWLEKVTHGNYEIINMADGFRLKSR